MTNPNDFGIPSGVGAGMEGTVGVAGLLPMVGGIYDTYQRSRDVKTEIAARKAEAELAYQRQVQMWHMQNAYNTPEQQMARFGAAGLNPHLIYGQGSAGQAGTPPAYQPPDIQTQGLSPAYGGAVASALPTLMSVGTWMQNMRLSENKIQEGDQLVEFLKSRYPHEIRQFDQVEKLWPYQKDMQESGMFKSRSEVASLLEEFRHRFGADLDVGAPYEFKGARGKGMADIERLEKMARARLTSAQADWFAPSTIMKMVLGMIGFGALGRMGRAATRVVPRGAGRAATRGGAVRATEAETWQKRFRKMVDKRRR